MPGAAFPAPYGGKARQVQIDLDPQAMQAHHLSATDVQTAIGNQNQIIPAGNIKIGSYQYVVKLNNAADSIEGLNNLPVKTVDGATVFMRDVAHVRDGSPPQSTIVHVDGGRAVLIDRAEERRGFDPRCGPGHQGSAAAREAISCRTASRSTCSTTSRYSSRRRFPAWCAKARWRPALTSLMILLFLGSWRSTVIIATSIPLSVLSALMALWATGQTLNIMTLGGLALAVGILVDDATVTIENINWHLEHGKDVRTRHHGRRPPDRAARLCRAALHLHRLRADVLACRAWPAISSFPWR